MSDYVKQLEAQNEELRQKLAKSQKENEDNFIELSLYNFSWLESRDFPQLSFNPPEGEIVVNAIHTYQCDAYIAAVVFFDGDRKEWRIDCKTNIMSRDNTGFATAQAAMDYVTTHFNTRLENIRAGRRRALTGEAQWTT